MTHIHIQHDLFFFFFLYINIKYVSMYQIFILYRYHIYNITPSSMMYPTKVWSLYDQQQQHQLNEEYSFWYWICKFKRSCINLIRVTWVSCMDRLNKLKENNEKKTLNNNRPIKKQLNLIWYFKQFVFFIFIKSYNDIKSMNNVSVKF